MARPEKFRLDEVLTQQNLLSQDQLQFALLEQKRTGRKLGRVFVENNLVSEDQISEVIARQLAIPFINLKLFNARAALVRLMPETQARRFRALVLEDRGRSLLVGMVDPTDLLAYDDISRLLKRDIELAVINESDLLTTIDRTYRRTEEITDFARELEEDLGDTTIDFSNLSTTPGIEEAPIVKLLQSVFEDAGQVRASDIHIEPQESRLHIRFRIDGVLRLQTETDLKIAPSLALRLKLMADLDISEKRLPQDGRFSIKIRQRKVDVRISTMPTQYGESVVMRLLSQNTTMPQLNAIGMPPAMVQRFREIIRRPTGLVLVTGPTGSGKTTTLYGALTELNTPERKLITVEDPVEYRLSGVNQVQVNEKIDLTFARVLRSSLRQDPDVVLVGEMRDQETAQIGLRAALTGHMVLSTLHTNDAASTPTRLLDMGVPRYMVGSALQVVVAQRLIRLICDSCRTDTTISNAELAWYQKEMRRITPLAGSQEIPLPSFKHGKGCPHCHDSGYSGRTGVYEMLEMTDEVAEAASHENPAHFMKVARQQMAGFTLSAHAIDLVRKGQTTVSEAMRVTNISDE